MPVQKLNLCAKCAKPLTYEQKLFFSCDKCGLAKSAIEDLAMFDEKYCGNCGSYLEYGKEIVLHGTSTHTKKLYLKKYNACSNCGNPISSVDEDEYFTCPQCGRVCCRMKKLPTFENDYCTHCEASLGIAKEEALAYMKENAVLTKED